MNTKIELPPESIEAAGRFIKSAYHLQGISLGFCVNFIQNNELTFLITKESNRYLDKNPYDEITYFYVNKQPFSVWPNFSVYPINQTINYYGNLIVTDVVTWQSTLESPARRKFFYVYDPMQFNFVRPEIVEKIKQSPYTIIARSAAHAAALSKIGLKPINKYVPHIDIKEFMEIINNDGY